MHHLQRNVISIELQINSLNTKLQNITNLPMFNTIYIRKESGNYKCKCTFNFWIIFLMEWMGLADIEKIMNIRLQVCKFKPQSLKCFSIHLVNNGHG